MKILTMGPSRGLRLLSVLFVGLLGLALGMSCSQSLSKPGDQGTGGEGGSGGTGVGGDGDGGSPSGGPGGGGGLGGTRGCLSPHYFAAGCNVAPRCPEGAGGACASLACGCSGRILNGCNNEYPEPYAYTIPIRLPLDGGGYSIVDASYPPVDGGFSCDPNAANQYLNAFNQ